MASTLACLGFDLVDEAGLDEVLATLTAEPLGESDGLRLVRHVDRDSGARLLLAVDLADERPVDLVPSVAAEPGARLGGLVPFDGGPWLQADVMGDRPGERDTVLTRLLVDLEQGRLPATAAPLRASVVALGTDVALFADEAAYDHAERTAGHDPLRESRAVISVGHLSAAAGDSPTPSAWLAGVVLAAETRRNGATGQDFHVVRVETVGFIATLCLAATEHPEPPPVGGVVAGRCYLVADLPSLWPESPGSPESPET